VNVCLQDLTALPDYQSIGLPMNMFPVLFAIPRTAGWLTQWVEILQTRSRNWLGPDQVYLRAPERDYVAMDQRK
jgi:citrate synthase